jgi:hypothetical protein
MRLKAKVLRDYVNIVSRVIEALRDNMSTIVLPSSRLLDVKLSSNLNNTYSTQCLNVKSLNLSTRAYILAEDRTRHNTNKKRSKLFSCYMKK